MIISASRRTDIPAFYTPWFMNRLRQGSVSVRNPFNARQISKISLSPDAVDGIVFWTKNPAALIRHLPEIDRLGFSYYFQFTVTPYDAAMERALPGKREIIATFRHLAETIGPHRVIWRYDPIVLSPEYDTAFHLRQYESLARRLSGYTGKCTFSFLTMYRKCIRNLHSAHVREGTREDKVLLAEKIGQIAAAYSLPLEACAQEEDFGSLGIYPGKCIDDALLSQLTGMQIATPHDKNQRPHCRCATSIDIGAYNTCRHYCRYCYANFSEKAVRNNAGRHDPESPVLVGNLTGVETCTRRNKTTKQP